MLRSAHGILAEDTRRTSVLLRHHGIGPKRLVSYHEHNEKRRENEVCVWVRSGEAWALVSDAGSPGISDPGARLVSRFIKEGLHVTALPGATAFVPALTISGLPMDNVRFHGFPPRVQSQRAAWLQALTDDTATQVFYEAPHRLLDTLRAMVIAFGEDRQCSVARELTKKYEEVRRGQLVDVLSDFESRARIRGEFVLVLAGAEKQAKLGAGISLSDLVAKGLDEGLGTRDIGKLATESGYSHRAAYRLALAMKEGQEDKSK